MRVHSSHIEMDSSRQAVSHQVRRTSLRVWIGDGEQTAGPGRGAGAGSPMDRVSLSPMAQHAVPEQKDGCCRDKMEVAEDGSVVATGDTELDLLISFIEHLTGKKVKILDPEEVLEGKERAEKAERAAEAAGEAPERAGWGMEYEEHESHYEAERTTVAVNGVIRTGDGKEIDFSLNLEMSREFYSEESLIVRAGDAAVDPLVLNFSGTAAQLTDRKFAFDLDADGEEDNISFVRPGSGFLALDKNRDGEVNDGTELFGPATGDGFRELAAYDEDGNNWIDESDSVYEDLSVWIRDAEGRENLSGLKEAGVGAIHLGRMESRFDVKDAGNQLQGQVQSTGIFVEEEGEVKSVQQINLVT